MRTTIAGLLALAAAQEVGIDHPWWAAMTVWLVAQPTPGLLLERSLARLVGTICGATVGASILTLWMDNLLIASGVLAAWLGLCAGLGTIFRHFRNYGFVLAGYTAGIVVMLGLDGGVADGALAQDRILCTLIGVASSAALSFRALSSRDDGAEMMARNLLERVILRVESDLHGYEPASDPSLLSEISAFDRALDQFAAGSLHRRADALRLRYISGALLELIALTTPGQGNRPAPNLEPRAPGQHAWHLAQSATASGRLALAHTLCELAAALEPSPWSAKTYFWFDFDFAAIWRAAARPVLALAIAVAVWIGVDWQAGAMMAMTAVLFTSLFSDHDHGNHMVIQVLLGTVVGATAGSLVRLYVLPHADSLFLTLFSIMPFLLIAAWLMRQSATAKMAIDMAMTFLLTAQPGSAPTATGIVLSEAAAIVSGVMIAVAIFWLVPSTPALRRDALARRVARLTKYIAEAAEGKNLAAYFQRLRNAHLRLLDVTEADSALFKATQVCVAAAGNVREYQQESARNAATKASVALDALIASNNRRTPNA